jgi:putative ABC transport system ATP-binding protein
LAPVRLRTESLRSQLAGPFNLEVAAGSCVAITGPSGSGKSLMLRMIADLDPSTGRVWLDDRERGSFTPPAWRRRVLYNAAEPGWWADHVADHFHGPALPFARDMAPRLGLAPDLLDSPVARLSTGERQRLALIRALANDRPVLLLDEATGALDETATALVEDALRARLAKGTTILLVTHNPEQAARMGQQLFNMRNGKLVPA